MLRELIIIILEAIDKQKENIGFQIKQKRKVIKDNRSGY
jgi:hypothetical protein